MTRTAGLLVALLLLASCGDTPPVSGRLTGEPGRFAAFRHELGPFDVALEGNDLSDARLRVFHRSRPEHALFETVAGRAFLEIARGRARLAGEGAGRFVVDTVQERCLDQTIDEVEAQLYVVRISGRLHCTLLERPYELYVVPEGPDQLRLHVRLSDASFNRVALTFAREPGERVFGTGSRERFEHTGQRVPILVTEPGSVSDSPGGRLSGWLRRRPAPPVGSPAPMPHWLTSRGRSILLENAEYTQLDFTRTGETRVEVHASELTLRVVHGESPREHVRSAVAAAGLPPAIPGWIHRGPIVGVGGGIGAVRETVAALARHGITPAAFHIKDAFAEGSSGSIDGTRYPEWEGLVASLRGSDVRILLDAGPTFPAELPGAEAAEPTTGAHTAGYHVRTAEGAAYPVGGPASTLLDLSRPDARAFLVERFQATRIAAGASGLRLTGGGAMPFDGRVGRDRKSAADHNLLAQRLSRVGARAFREAERPVEGVLLAETAFVRSPGHGVVLRAGDASDPASFVRALSAGLSGFAYAEVSVSPSPSSEDLERSLLLAAFAPVFSVAADALTTPEALDSLARAARIHAAWSGYRGELVRQATISGLPVLRPLWLHHPEEPAFQAAAPESFLIGTELLVIPAPVGAKAVEASLPAGRWIDVFDGVSHGDPGSGVARPRITVRPHHPAVLHPEGSIVGQRFRKALATIDSDGDARD